MDKNTFAPTPPMGWNSYDYYDTTVNEEQIKANADFMAKNLLKVGFEYVVIDIEWYAHNAGTQREKFQYIPFWNLEIDEYSRLLPCPERFPSSANGMGFKPLADYIHSLGLKFGIHIMRGIPRIAAHNHMKIKGVDVTANEIAEPSNICFWNPDMYGVNVNAKGSQEYYDSIMELYASWDVDFIKVDDICRMDMPTAKQEIIMLHKAIEKCGRPIVLSLSPGPAKIEEAWHYEKYSNMWRITDDFWDKWELLLNMFERCELWQKHVSPGCYPDCDMIPLGKIGYAFGNLHDTSFTKEEQKTMLTLWAIFRSPMMLGCELTMLDDWTLSLLTNEKVMNLISGSKDAYQVERDNNHAVWFSQGIEEGTYYLAIFNFDNEAKQVALELNDLSDETQKVTLKLDNSNDESKEVALELNDLSDETQKVALKLDNSNDESKEVALELNDLSDETQKVALKLDNSNDESKQVALELNDFIKSILSKTTQIENLWDNILLPTTDAIRNTLIAPHAPLLLKLTL